MKKLAFALPLAALLATSGAAFAAETYSGNLTYMNASTGEVGLDSGQHFKISNPGLLQGILPGEQVIITKNDDNTVGFQEDSSYFDKGQNYN